MKQSGMPAGYIADLIFKVCGYQAQKFFDGIRAVVNLKSHALQLHIGSLIRIEVLCPVLDPCKGIVDIRELCSNV